MKTCAFTGHRPKGLGYPESDGRCAALKEKLRSLIIRMIEEEGVTHFISGMAQGVDMYAAEIVLELKKQYTPDCLRKRNRYMVDHADTVLAVWNGGPSGTGQTVWCARETGKPV